ncbi:MAG: cobalamin biosynthesis protein CobD [Deltaproteobacteria bacterium RBG_13_51_10]|nr:MAG: cobalamin biosynthesis protein CobD [Deltaproteobacteria bacterium RBG_13_51_10]
MLASITLISAYLLDIILGDPQRFPHPVRLIGRFIVFLENLFWRANSSPLSQKISGILLALIVVGSTFMATTFLIYWAGYFSQAASFILSIFMGYFTLATRDLHVETRRVLKALEAGDLARARQELSFLVGRDTAHLSEPEVIRALVETIAENLSDGVIAPLFYLGLGGPPWAMTYKAINTLDSMVGYKKERFRHMGWASARLDDAANFIPARLSGGLVVISAFLLGKPWRDSLEILRRDRRQHQSPNSAWPEAATAGALGVQLGGLNYYGGQPSPKPFIGNRKKDLDFGDVREAWKILYLSSFGMLLLALLLNWAMEGFFCLR